MKITKPEIQALTDSLNLMKLKLMYIKEAQGEQVTSSMAVKEMLREESRADRECFWVLHLNTKNKIIEKELVSMGSLNASLIHPREVFRKAVVNNSSRLILAHNHPGGDPSPSQEDDIITKRLKSAGTILGIEVLDHIVLGNDSYYSYADKGRL